MCGVPAPPSLCEIDGIAVNVASIDHVLREITKLLSAGHSFFLCTLNLDHVVKLQKRSDFRAVYKKASLITLDGAPLVWLARRSGANICRTTGADLLEPICELASTLGHGVFLIGPNESINDRFRQRFAVLTSGSASLHCAAPSRAFDPAGVEADALIERLGSSGARICLVAIGAPKQELFAARAAERLTGICFVPIGAAVEFMAGTKSRAPHMLQHLGLEWTWRLAHEPRRLASRYGACGLAFLKLATVELLRGASKRHARTQA